MQPAVDQSNTEAVPPVNDANELSLEAVLKEFDAATTPEQTQASVAAPATKESLTEDVKLLVNEIKTSKEEKAKADIEAGIVSSVSTLKESLKELPIALPDKILRGILNGYATDEKVLKAFAMRESDPNSWSKVLKGIANEVRKEFSVDQKVTNDVSALANAARSSKTQSTKEDTGFDDKKVRQMSDAEFNQQFGIGRIR